MKEELTLRTLEQKRAEVAWECVSEVMKKNETLKKEYLSLVRRMPALIMNSGLGQALAFLLSKAKSGKAEEMVYQHLSRWLCSQEAPLAWGEKELKEKLLNLLIKKDSVIYCQAAYEALRFVSWLKRFADAQLKEVETEKR